MKSPATDAAPERIIPTPRLIWLGFFEWAVEDVFHAKEVLTRNTSNLASIILNKEVSTGNK